MNNIFGQRLKSARLMNGLSLQALSDKLDNVVSKQALNKYEKGLMYPNSKILRKIATVLGLKADYFFKERKIELSSVEFRKKTRMNKRDQDAVKEKTIDFLERYIEVELLLDMEIKFNNPLSNVKIKNHEDVEEAAESLRKAWKLGLNPIHNVAEMLEDKGIKIFETDNDQNFDGLSAWVEDVPVIVLNKNVDIVRKRFTALHEFAHLAFSFSSVHDYKDNEKLCHGFAGAFLLPKQELIRELGRVRKRISMQELIALKAYYGISIQAIMARSLSIGLLNERRYRSFRMFMAKSNYLKQEPGDFKGLEEANRFKNLVHHAASEELITLNKAASLLNMQLSELQKNFQVI